MKHLIEAYLNYVKALRSGDGIAAVLHAREHNRILKSLGGPKKCPGEHYLSMGKKGYRLPLHWLGA